MFSVCCCMAICKFEIFKSTLFRQIFCFGQISASGFLPNGKKWQSRYLDLTKSLDGSISRYWVLTKASVLGFSRTGLCSKQIKVGNHWFVLSSGTQKVMISVAVFHQNSCRKHFSTLRFFQSNRFGLFCLM